MSNPVDIEACYNAHLPAAQALPAANVLTVRLDPDLAIVNIDTAMHVFVEHAAEIPEHFPKVDLSTLKALPEIALATKYAALRAEQQVPAESQMAAKLSEARALRAKLLSAAKALAENGLLPQAEVAAIAAGSGTRDRAEDCVALAALYRNHDATIAGKHPITTDMIDQAATVGSWLVANLRPGNAPSVPSAGPSAAVDLRNRFATLLVDGHHKLQAIAHYFHPTDWEERVPALGSRRVAKKKNEAGNG
ncbi:MAG: hypothetical protein IPM54_42225 [Polyangiaceae bacterium]|nr:hypothetical protein [Polyangiaceae bacterium]